MEQRRVLITGAGSGLGRALAFCFAENGWRVACADINLDSAKDTVRLLTEFGVGAMALWVDVGDDASVEEMRDEVLAAWDGVDVVVNNAGVASAGAVVDVGLDDWRWTLNINLMGVVRGCRAFLPILLPPGPGPHRQHCLVCRHRQCAAHGAPIRRARPASISLSEMLRAELALAHSAIGVSVGRCPAFFQTNLMHGARAPGDRHGGRIEADGECEGERRRCRRHDLPCAMRGDFLILPTAGDDALAHQAFLARAVLSQADRHHAVARVESDEPLHDLRRQRLHRPPDCARSGQARPEADAGRDAIATKSSRWPTSWDCRSACSSCPMPNEIARNLDDIDLVLHCAGPFSRTAAPMLEACLERKVHYLDITGEIDVFELCHRAHARAQASRHRRAAGLGFRRRADRLRRRDAQAAPARCDIAGARVRGRRRPESRHGEDQRRGPGQGRARAHRRRTDDGAAGLEVARIRARRQGAHGDDDSVGRRLHRVRVDRHPEHRNLHGRVAEDDPARALDARVCSRC